jgi:CRP/FNR family transcriptional regulator, cyclic AMP receptor protein
MPTLPIPTDVEINGRVIEAQVGERLLVSAAGDSEVFVVTSGLLRLERDGDESEGNVRVIGAGDVVCAELILGETIAWRIQVLTTTRLLAISLRKVDANLNVCRWVMGLLMASLQKTEREIQWMRTHGVESRVQLHLNELCTKVDDGNIPISQADLAQTVGATRETISTVLNRLARLGVIQLSRKSIRVVHPSSLSLSKAAAQ